MQPDSSRDAAAVRIFPLAIPLLTVLAGVGLNHLYPIHFGFELATPERYWLGGAIVVGALLGLGLWSVVLLRWILVLTPICALLLQTLAIVPEERYLESRFGEGYLEYKRRVPRWI